jgi:N-acetylneuraminic acid mutarotase
MKARIPFGILAFIFFGACGGSSGGEAPDAAPPAWAASVALPVALSNNAVTSVTDGAGCSLYSVMGIGGALTASDIIPSAYRWREGEGAWSKLPDMPTSAPRVAAHAVGLRGQLYVIGGYSVGPGTAETSFVAMDVYDPAGGWSAAPSLPIPIDDAVVAAWRDRWIVVVSGWSNTSNVDAVQIYDADTQQWAMGTPFPGTAAFGPAGALAQDELLIIDGVGDQGGFDLVNQAWLGELDPDDPTDDPYNYNGLS